MWNRIYGKEIEVSLINVDLTVICECKLHNWLRTTPPALTLKDHGLIKRILKLDLFSPWPVAYNGNRTFIIEKCSLVKHLLKTGVGNKEETARIVLCGKGEYLGR